MKRFIATLMLVLIAAHSVVASAEPDPPAQVQTLRITVLSTMVADYGMQGEWGFSALVEADGRKLLVDTGAAPDTVLRNAEALGIDLSDVEDVVLTHNHDDHTAGLLSLRAAFQAKNPLAMSRVHAAPDIFLSRPENGSESSYMRLHRAEMEQIGIHFVLHEAPTQLLPGVWFSGPVPRPFPERNWSGKGLMVQGNKTVEDNIPEDASLAINTAKGTVLLSGCGHAGVANTMSFVQQRLLPGQPITTLVGGFHLFVLNDERLLWTGAQMQAFGVKWLLGAHCTGFESVYHLRRQLGLPRDAAVVGVVGSRYTLSQGISPGLTGLNR